VVNIQIGLKSGKNEKIREILQEDLSVLYGSRRHYVAIKSSDSIEMV